GTGGIGGRGGVVLGSASDRNPASNQPFGGGRGRRWPSAFSQRNRPRGFLPHQHWDWGVDRTGRGHHAIVGDGGVAVGPVGRVAALPLAVAGGVWRGGGHRGGVQRADNRGDFRGAHRSGEFLDEPVCAAAVLIGRFGGAV